MTIEEIKSYFLQNFSDFKIQEADGDFFIMKAGNEKIPAATLITRDNDYDSLSQLNREGYFRLNLPIDKEEFNRRFGGLTGERKLETYMHLGLDFTQEDTLLPHPTYGSLYWVCVVNPSRDTFESLMRHFKH